jgi:hypothetical protein
MIIVDLVAHDSIVGDRDIAGYAQLLPVFAVSDFAVSDFFGLLSHGLGDRESLEAQRVRAVLPGDIRLHRESGRGLTSFGVGG